MLFRHSPRTLSQAEILVLVRSRPTGGCVSALALGSCTRSHVPGTLRYTFNIFADGELLPLLEEMDEGKGDYTYGGKSGELRIMWYVDVDA